MNIFPFVGDKPTFYFGYMWYKLPLYGICFTGACYVLNLTSSAVFVSSEKHFSILFAKQIAKVTRLLYRNSIIAEIAFIAFIFL